MGLILKLYRVANTTMHDIGKHRFGVAGWRAKLLRYKYMFNDMFFNNRYLTLTIQQ